MILVQWQAVGTVGHSDGSSTEGPIKSLRHITVGHLLGIVTDELWEILAHTHTDKRTQPLSHWFSTQGGARHTPAYDRFGLEVGVQMCVR